MHPCDVTPWEKAVWHVKSLWCVLLNMSVNQQMDAADVKGKVPAR